MSKIKKHLTSTIVFVINLILMGVGFLFIKNSDETKKQAVDQNNENSNQDILTEVKSEAEALLENNNPGTAEITQDIPVDSVSIPSSTASTTPSQKTSNTANAATDSTKNSNTKKKKNSSSSSSNNSSTSTSRSSATTKTS